METCLSEWEHHSTLCEHRCFYKHCGTDVISYVSKTALPKIQRFWVNEIHTSGSNDIILVETETERGGLIARKYYVDCWRDVHSKHA